jgi:hypothetical protein
MWYREVVKEVSTVEDGVWKGRGVCLELADGFRFE